MAKIKVYHGSNCEVKVPSLSYGREDADFGIYEMSDWLEIAYSLLEKRVEILKKYIAGIEKWISQQGDESVPIHHVATVERMADLAKAELSGTNRLLERKLIL